MIAISLTLWLRLLKKRIVCIRRLRFFGKRKKMLAFITNVKNLRGKTELSVIFFPPGTQENDIANIMWEQYHTRVGSSFFSGAT